MFKFKKTPDRHNAIQNLNYYIFPDPPLFSLPSTFNLIVFTVCLVVPGQVLGQVEIPSPEELEEHPIPPALGQNQQWWPQQTPPPSTTPPGMEDGEDPAGAGRDWSSRY
jgi:hypothetical protein